MQWRGDWALVLKGPKKQEHAPGRGGGGGGAFTEFLRESSGENEQMLASSWTLSSGRVAFSGKLRLAWAWHCTLASPVTQMGGEGRGRRPVSLHKHAKKEPLKDNLRTSLKNILRPKLK